MRRAVIVAVLVISVAVPAAVFALNARYERSRVATPTPTASPTASASATATPGDVRGINFADPAVLAPILQHFGGGEVPKERVVYADLTGDRIEEAVAIVESGGTMGDLGAAVFGLEQGTPRLLGYVEGGGRVEVTFGKDVAGLINVKQGVYAPTDPLCCPTGIRETVYQWDGAKFSPISSQTLPSPQR